MTNPTPPAPPSNLGVEQHFLAGEEDRVEKVADDVAEALASVSVAYTHATLMDMTTANRSWKVYDSYDGNPFDKNEWLGEFDSKAEAHAFVAKLRRERAIAAARAAIAAMQPGGWQPIETAPYTMGGGRKGHWLLTVNGRTGEVEIACREHDGEWTGHHGGSVPTPRCWMPLPAAPIAAATSGKEGGR